MGHGVPQDDKRVGRPDGVVISAFSMSSGCADGQEQVGEAKPWAAACVRPTWWDCPGSAAFQRMATRVVAGNTSGRRRDVSGCCLTETSSDP